MPTAEQLFESFINQLDVRPNNTAQLFVIGIVGLVGSGKSTVAKQIAEAAGIYVASNDAIRRFMNEQGIAGDSPDQPVLQYIAEHLTDYLYEQHISHIIDADLLKFYESARRRAEQHGAAFYLIEVTCPDVVIRQRIADRSAALAGGGQDNLSRVGIEEYEKRLQIHRETPRPDFDVTIASDQPLAPQIADLVDRLQQDHML